MLVQAQFIPDPSRICRYKCGRLAWEYMRISNQGSGNGIVNIAAQHTCRNLDVMYRSGRLQSTRFGDVECIANNSWFAPLHPFIRYNPLFTHVAKISSKGTDLRLRHLIQPRKPQKPHKPHKPPKPLSTYGAVGAYHIVCGVLIT
jgi:hypothetical protein